MLTERDKKNLLLTEQIAKIYSKDPSTKVGAYIVDQDNRPVSIGYNGFPRGVVDSKERLENREVKLKYTVHAEANALLHTHRDNLGGCTLYVWPFEPCPHCAALVINSGIKRVVTLPNDPYKSKWEAEFMFSRQMFQEAEVTLEYLKDGTNSSS